MENCSYSHCLKDLNTTTFAISESSMSFYFDYCENGIEIRSKMEVDGEIIDEEGEKLEIEKNEEDMSEIIFKQTVFNNIIVT